jgi:hypothetical protein
MLKKSKVRLILFIAVVLSLGIILLQNRVPFGKGNTSFSSKPGKEITRIELSGKEGKVTLEKKNGRWLVNGKNEARKNSIMFISRILLEMDIKSPVSESMFDTATNRKGIAPVIVKVWEKRKMLNSFMVYKTQSNAYGNIMKKKSGSKPFIVYVPGHDGDIGSAFTLNSLFWQPYTIFEFLPSELSSVELENVRDSSNTFTITKTGKGCTFYAGSNQVNGCDTTLINRYISYFTWIPFESWALDLTKNEREQILASTPIYRINVIPVKGEKLSLTLWEKKKEDGGTDSDRLYGKSNSSDEIFIVRYFDVDPLLKKRSYFFESNSQ